MTDGLYGGEQHRPFVFAADAERGVSALLIHGFMGTPKEPRALGRVLAAAGIAAHGLCLPGFGDDLANLGDTKRAAWIATANAAWDDLTGRSRRTVLVGFSMGGAVALHVAARRPPDRLVLLAPLFRIADRRAVALPILKRTMKELRPFERATFRDPATRELLLQMDPDPDLDLDDPAVQARLRTESRIPLTAVDELRRMAADDRVVRPAYTRRLLARLGGVLTYHEVPCDHLLVLEERASWPRVRELVLGHVAPLLDPLPGTSLGSPPAPTPAALRPPR